ncbi:MAG: hypothetical protein WBG04_11200 [Haloferula sp.]
MIPDSSEKSRLYREAELRISGLLDGEPDALARMAGVVAVLHGTMPHYFWTGFYRVVGSALVIGPYQGTPGCGRIPWGRGVCGTAWKTGATQVVKDVHAFPGHIACDARSESEIVCRCGIAKAGCSRSSMSTPRTRGPSTKSTANGWSGFLVG